MSASNIKLESVDEGVLVLKFSRPQALNALNTEMLLEFKGKLRDIRKNSAVRVLILTGDGEKSFIAGADIVEMKDKTSSEGVEFARLGHEVMQGLETLSKPVIAAVNGYALGGGTEMALACDFIFASETAVFGQPEVSLGIIPGFGGTVRLSKFVGLPRAKELIFSGRRINAREALQFGLVNRVLPAGELLPQTIEFARKMAQNSPLAIAISKKLLHEFSESVGHSYKLDAEAQEFGTLFNSPDQMEGMTAFVEKRKPRFENFQQGLGI